MCPSTGFCVRAAQPFLAAQLSSNCCTLNLNSWSRGSGRVAHSMSLVTPNTNTLNVNNEVTHGTARHGTEHGNGNGNGVTVIVLPVLPCPVLPHRVLSSSRVETTGTGRGRRTDPTRPGCAASPLLTFDTVTAFSDLFHVDMRRCHDNQRQPAPASAPCTCSP